MIMEVCMSQSNHVTVIAKEAVCHFASEHRIDWDEVTIDSYAESVSLYLLNRWPQHPAKVWQHALRYLARISGNDSPTPPCCEQTALREKDQVAEADTLYCAA